MIPLTNEDYESYSNKLSYLEKTSNINTLMTKVIVNLNTIVIMHANTGVLHIEYMI